MKQLHFQSDEEYHKALSNEKLLQDHELLLEQRNYYYKLTQFYKQQYQKQQSCWIRQVIDCLRSTCLRLIDNRLDYQRIPQQQNQKQQNNQQNDLYNLYQQDEINFLGIF